MFFERRRNLADLPASAFLFGPRMTGKTTLLRTVSSQASFDLLDPELELRYKGTPQLFWEEISALGEGARVAVDEIQRAPELLNYVQMAIDRLDQRFLLSGSSARKLRRGGANLLGGRALDLRLHPLSSDEMGDSFDIDRALSYGSLPKIATLLIEGKEDLAKGMLSSYVTTYIKEEIQAEAVTRNIGAFSRFLSVAAQSHAQTIEFANISRECSVPASTVKEYYQILEDTMIGFFLWPFDRNERKKARPKSYLFDCGVARAIQNRLNDPPTPQEKGFLFESWFVNELKRIRDYSRKTHEFAFWRELNHEIDILVTDGGGVRLAIECKAGREPLRPATVRRFRDRFPGVRLIVASLKDERKRLADSVDILPWKDALNAYREA